MLFLTKHKSNWSLLSCDFLTRSTVFWTEAVFIVEQITKYRFGILLDTTGKITAKLNVFNYIILQFRRTSLKYFITIPYDFEKRSG